MFGRSNRKAYFTPIQYPIYNDGYVQQIKSHGQNYVRQSPYSNYSFNQQQGAHPYYFQQNPYNQMQQSSFPNSNMQNHMNYMYPPFGGGNQPFPQAGGEMNGYPQNGMNSYYQQYQGGKKHSQSVLQNPLQEEESYFGGGNTYYENQMPYMNPYPKASFIPRPPSGIQSIMNSFKGQDGSLDFNKMMDTAGAMMNAVNQVSGMVKGLGGIFKV
ncbi:YppG family protein [Cytobacillus sp. FJAT-54145]|uniref:YppG family protein n=1 Tax=Cytobacillus spartinae TaxID=3299023 RepID=A0ABW6KDF0_9BACI